MQVKKYTASTSAEAMARIREELGEDAFILTQQTIRKKGLAGIFAKPMIEIVAAYEAPTDPYKPPRPPVRQTPKSQPRPKPPQRSRPQLDLSTDDVKPSISQTNAAAYTRMGTPAKTARSETPSAARALELLDMIGTSAVSPHLPPMRAAEPSVTLPLDNKPKDTAFEEVSFPVLSEHIVGREPETLKDDKINALQSKIDALSSSVDSLVGKIKVGGTNQSYGADIDGMLLALLENETHEEFAGRVCSEVLEIVKKKGEDPREVMEQILRQHIGAADPIRLKKFKRTVVMLVGSTGVGKTTTLAKLAAVYSLNHHAKVGVITTDTYRIAAVDQLKTYTQILEIPLSIVYTPAEVAEALRDHEDKDLVLIDTAGKSPADTSHEEEITELIRHSACDEVHLVVSATTGFTGLLNILNAYAFLTDFKIIVTKLDETPAWGGILNARFLTDKPLSYNAIGQNVPDDIEVADIRKIISKLTNR